MPITITGGIVMDFRLKNMQEALCKVRLLLIEGKEDEAFTWLNEADAILLDLVLANKKDALRSSA